ncbi:alkylphosphonate utilization protein [bacterium]|jgi:protein PhnA|nr:alkylphosphonate utilization protein [bacterium]
MTNIPKCPKCNSDYVYEDRDQYVCPDCAHEWMISDAMETASGNKKIISDSNGTPLTDGDTISVIKDLKIKGTSSVVKKGTKVKNIKLVDGDHDIDCKITGIGPMKLKSEFVKKIN